MKHLGIWLLCSSIPMFIGCQSEVENSIHSTMQAVSDAIHQRDTATISAHLSQASQQRIDETYEALSKLQLDASALPLAQRQKLESELPPSVVSKKPALFITDMLDERLKTVTLDEHTRAGLEIVAIVQESKNEAQAVTKSGQRFAFSLEEGSWKIHLFEKGLRAVIDDTREAAQALKLTIERNEKRRQIESVIHNALKNRKK